MDNRSKQKPLDQLTGVQGPRRRFFETAAAEVDRVDVRGLGGVGSVIQADIPGEGAPVKSAEGSAAAPIAPKRREFEMPGTAPAGGPLINVTPAPPKGRRNFVVPEVSQPVLPTAAPPKSVRARHFGTPEAPPAEGTLGKGSVPSQRPRGTRHFDIQGIPMAAPQCLETPLPKVRARNFETAETVPPAGPGHVRPVGPTIPQHHVDGVTTARTHSEELPANNMPKATVRRRHFETPVGPAEASFPQPPADVSALQSPAGQAPSEAPVRPAPRQRKFELAEGTEKNPNEGPEKHPIEGSAEPRTLQDIEGSPDSGVEVPLSVFVEQLIDDSRPMDPKLKYYTPPPEAQRLMVRNIARRHNGATHPLEGYYTPEDPSNIHFDNTQYPDNFVPPLISYHTEDQLRNAHWKVKTADYNTATYQEKLHFVKGARLTQLEWELNNINLLGEIGKELQELNDELLPLVLQ